MKHDTINQSILKREYLAFDIETAKVLPGNSGDLHAHRPLGITCAAVWAIDEAEPDIFYSTGASGSPSAQMSSNDLSELVDILKSRRSAGYTIVTHNGLGFDFDILAEESGRMDDCRELALDHIDMMFHVFCKKGYGVGLNAAAKAIGASKPEGMSGSDAPRLWKQGNHQQVLDYVAHDCRLTLKVAEKSEKEGSFKWITQKGKTGFFALPSGWLTVAEANKLPLPDTSWMDNPWPRSKLSGWLDD